MKKAGFVSLLVWTSIGVAILLGLGTWQLFRLSEKTAYLAQLDERVRAAPVTLQDALARSEAGDDIEFLKVSTTGSYFEPSLFKQATLKGGPGWEVITPFKSSDNVVVLIDRGTIPADLRSTPAPANTAAETVEAVIRRHDHAQGFFDPENDAATETWYWWDVPAMLGTLHIAADDKVAPFILQRLPEAGAPPYPVAEDLAAGIPNNHLQYAITWFALAACLLVIAGLRARRYRT